MTLDVRIKENEHWWGGAVCCSDSLPITENSVYDYNMADDSNQTMPLLISDMGRYVWCYGVPKIHASGGVITLECSGNIELTQAGSSLREAYLAAKDAHFPFTGKLPPEDFFTSAQYNTWMELDYNQSQDAVLKYAHSLIDAGFEPGVLMIDEGWHTRYGIWEFDRAKFPDPKAMIDELHSLSFRVMLWVVPNYTADGQHFVLATDPRLSLLDGAAKDKKYLLRTDSGEVALVKWWNGYSAIYNMCREEDRALLRERLMRLVRDYGVDGFKFDGGNLAMYAPYNVVNGNQTAYTAEELNAAWIDFGREFEYHEYKDCFGAGGLPIIQRLQDRFHTWEGHGIDSILPAALNAGLTGHPFICPDMVGGGEWLFNYMPGFKCDEELFVRMAQCSALFPMIQFSWLPGRMLSEENAALCLAAAKMHKDFSACILRLAKESAASGEPIIRAMEYSYPHEGFAEVNDQFMLGDDILVAPVIQKGGATRRVRLPEGRWNYLGEEEYIGGSTVTVSAPLSVLPYFVKG